MNRVLPLYQEEGYGYYNPEKSKWIYGTPVFELYKTDIGSYIIKIHGSSMFIITLDKLKEFIWKNMYCLTDKQAEFLYESIPGLLQGLKEY
jgi:hypothetical protein